MKIFETNIKDLLIIKPTFFEDHRGEYIETWNKEFYNGINLYNIDWVQDDFSYSYKSVLKGLHGDWKTWKLVQAIYGKLFLAVVDCRGPSKGEVFTITLTNNTHTQILIPPGCANGYQCLSENGIFHYKQSTYYNKYPQFTLKYDTIGINWPINPPILSERDMNGDILTNIY